ncbi:MAG: amidohydrolase family protein [Pigmentiphaga sp.]|uniref:amidohydrolase family protein n=1 Tax=Pigmentiphaga sp. TaxID=1977564 RepID=UPI0029AAC22A|nr:amidohydrolase family protein [Pigmentiphaga sp.]MDX3907808.1 amidohydrolase family protein [Pigmentiphaga sp.]
MLIVDAQVHIWAADRPDRPWPPGEAHRAHRPEPLSAEKLLEEMAEAGVHRAVLIPPSWEGDRNDLVLDASRRFPDRFGAFCRVPLDETAGREELAALATAPGMLGLRFTFHKEAGLRALLNGTPDWIWPAAAEAGIPVMLHAPRALHAVEKIAREHAGLRIIVDHLGLERPDQDAAAFHRLPELLRLADYRNVAVKATALPSYSSEPYPHPGLRDPLRKVIDAFGASRVFWGSDMTRVDAPYRQIVTHFTEELPFLDAADQAQIMGLALCNWVGWPLAHHAHLQGKTA